MLLKLTSPSSSLSLKGLLSLIQTLSIPAILNDPVSPTQIYLTMLERDKERYRPLFEKHELVVEIEEELSSYYLASRAFKDKTVVQVGNQKFGEELVVIMGPCSVESREQVDEMAAHLCELGVKIIRGGVFKPRSSPYSFQGIGIQGAQWLKEAADKYGLFVVSEVMSEEHISVMREYVDMFQVGSRNMQNFNLLKALSKEKHPILLKRGFSATYHEFLQAAEYILVGGNPNVVLCERGIRTFETHTRNTLDLCAVPALHALSHLPVIVDPSHGTGHSNYVAPMSLAAVACGADGVMIEVHNEPKSSLSDAEQALDFEQSAQLIKDLMALSTLQQISSSSKHEK